MWTMLPLGVICTSRDRYRNRSPGGAASASGSANGVSWPAKTMLAAAPVATTDAPSRKRLRLTIGVLLDVVVAELGDVEHLRRGPGRDEPDHLVVEVVSRRAA